MVPGSFSIVYSVSNDYINIVPHPLGHPQSFVYNLHPTSDLREVPYHSLSPQTLLPPRMERACVGADGLESLPPQTVTRFVLSDRT